MSEVKRYHEFKNGVIENKHGMFVKHTDYAALQQKLDALAAENAALKDYLKECSVVQGEGNWTSDSEKSVYVPAVEWAPPTPAADAYLNALRAEGIEVAANDLFEKTTVGHQMLMAFAAQLRGGNAGKDGSHD